ncbi:helix-turn-helix domain-containing protein [Paenibacillus mucilaginosus]|uniref:Transcriptional regulator, AraC family n=1 Tax=Paenibacillus mucilaginosus (strain KNP414) TaxID=1036673 RepID=F8FRS1_PAEMK|nr:helix-turn-helix domain-containing protein [Paenibacillus mucilaginosus]AEI40628.1 transcriptional regulator, AraC family [Paenibacillus mucilaginosus KNP414]MCG7216246.1 helix-turn-helix domain-containing protein [Paenibacillus mucilaginosus]WDM29771.1 helix-turn-helix domain-containing protein [Paenibacillus mucilaginosus]
MVRNWKQWSRSVAVKWIVSYAVIMIIPVLISAVVYMQTREIVEYEIRRASNAMLNQVKYVVDNELKQTEKLAAQLSIDPEIKRFLELEGDTEAAHSFQIYQTGQELSMYKALNDFVQGIYIYSNPLNKVLSSETYADAPMFYEVTHRSPGFTYEMWLSAVREPGRKTYRLMPVTDAGRMDETVVFQEALAKKGESRPAGALMMPINRNKILHLLENVDWVNQGRIFIMDEQNRILFQNRQGGSVPAASPGVSDEPDSIVSSLDSDTARWRYISVFPSDIFWEKARQIRNLNLLGLLVCCLIGAGVISYFARKNYGPVRELVHVFSRFKKDREESPTDEYTFIRENVLAALQEREEMNIRQDQQLRVLQGYYLSRLLKGQAEEALSAAEAAKGYRLGWKSEEFAVLLFHLEPGQDGGIALDLAHFIVSNIVMDLIGRRHGIHFADLDGMLAGLINIHPEHASAWKDDVEEALAEALEFIGGRYRLSFTAAGSGRQDGLQGIHQGFLQALEAREYSLLLEESGFIWYEAVKPEETDYYVSMNDEMILINLIKSGEQDKAVQMLDGLMAQVFGQHASIDIIRCAMIDLASTMLKTLPQEARRSAQWEERRPVKRLLACSTRAEFRQVLMEIVTLVCGRVNEKLSLAANPGVGSQVEEYVKANYADDNLSVSMIGAHFGITPQYVSKLFKEHAGQGLHDFISQYRVTQAKGLLDRGSPIEETAAKVGFSSSSAFIRVFKKYEGITPGKYKSIQ